MNPYEAPQETAVASAGALRPWFVWLVGVNAMVATPGSLLLPIIASALNSGFNTLEDIRSSLLFLAVHAIAVGLVLVLHALFNNRTSVAARFGSVLLISSGVGIAFYWYYCVYRPHARYADTIN